MQAGSGIFIIFYLFLVVVGIMSLFIPFWVLRIRNEIIATNRKLDELIRIGGGTPPADRPLSG